MDLIALNYFSRKNFSDSLQGLIIFLVLRFMLMTYIYNLYYKLFLNLIDTGESNFFNPGGGILHCSYFIF